LQKDPLKPRPLHWCLAPFSHLLFRQPKVRSLYLEVTHKCNLACLACYTCAGAEKPDALTLQEQKHVVAQAREMGARVVSLSGSGEPLLYRHLFELVDHIKGLGMAVVVFTNGTTLDPDTAKALMSCRVITYFKLYSLDPATFDRMAGKKDSYRWVQYAVQPADKTNLISIPVGLKNLLDAADALVARDCVGIETLITRMNSSTLATVARLAKDLGLAFHLETPVMTGRAMEHAGELVPTADDYATLYGELVQIFGKEHMAGLREHPCPVERNPVVWTNGDIGFCSSRAALVGNVRDVPLKDLFHRASMLKAEEDRAAARNAKASRYFRTCPARQLYESKNNIPCDY
jgi:MoaA/NifB/PqqE/SkfB family radical SAM enzyme